MPDHTPSGAPGETKASALASPDQRLAEERAISLVQSAEVRAAMAGTLALFMADRNAQLADQDALMRQSVAEHYFHAALMAATETPLAPHFVWTLAHDHRWMGLDVPGSRFGQDNSDNAYRVAAVDETLSYRISGRFVAERPCDFSVCALPGQIGENMLADVVAIISHENIDVDADGRFSITLDTTPTEGRRNHLCIARARTLHARDTLADWSTERPCELTIERTDAPPVDNYDAAGAASRAAKLGAVIASYFLDRVQHGMFETAPLNALVPPAASGTRGGLVTQLAAVGYYRLGDNEAIVITADRVGARYLGVQIVDMWMISYEYREHTSSLNHTQAFPDSDGLYRWVISRRDPGVSNWLDGSGHASGCILMRWQHLPPGADPAAQLSAKLVSLDDLRRILPGDTRFLDVDGRAAQRAKRLQDYRGRIG